MIDSNSLDLLEPVTFDDSVEKFTYLTFKPYNSGGLGYSDEIRIGINNRDFIVAPHVSYLCISGRVHRNNSTTFIHAMPWNGLMYLFSTITFEINGVPVDRVHNAGVTTTIKSYLSKTVSESKYYDSCGFNHMSNPYTSAYKITSSGYFQIYLPARFILGIFEDYRKPFTNCVLELILSRAKDDKNVFIHPGRAAAAADTDITAVDPTITLSEVSWKVPVLKLSDSARLQMLQTMKDNRTISIPFRTWEMFEYPTLPTSTNHSWTIKTSHSLHKPRYVIVAFQTDRRNLYSANASLFDNIHLQSFQLSLNDEKYPYEPPNLDVTNVQRDLLYHMFANFQVSYYKKPFPETCFSASDFLGDTSAYPIPMIVIDTSKQKEQETNVSGPINIRLDFVCSSNVPANTTAYCLIIYDRWFAYSAFDGNIKQIL
ncbi:uncharacterized protein LOC135834114 [Planococcus citri]|uniref:uncharacterized protein LOC135834114 n=1 Tax=Planococcus citri TaxID=170843 RepID=UPI0031F9AB61